MFYLNVDNAKRIYTEIVHDDIYVDKSMLIEKISSCIKKPSQKFICITRPRRFGKTYNANMLAAYYTKGYDTKELFDHLNISHSDNYLTHLNQYNVVYIDFSIMSNECCSYDDYIQMITHNMISDLKSQYTIDLTPNHSLYDYFNQTKDSFIFILDEL